MKINFLDLKELASKDKSAPGFSFSSEYKILTKYLVGEMFALHTKVSQTDWNRKMFDEEFNRENSGFLICYYNEDYEGDDENGGGGLNDFSAKFSEADIDTNIPVNLRAKLIGFLISYTVLDEIHILDITVDKEMQFRGIGSLMLDWTIKKYKSKGIKYFFLEVRVSNSIAISLYKKFGFKVFLLRKKYYDDNGEDALCMVKEL